MYVSITLLFAGLALLGSGLLTKPAGLEAALFGVADGRLAWGPALFLDLLIFHGLALCLYAVVTMRRRGRTAHVQFHLPGAPQHHPRAGALLAILCVIALGLRLYRLDTCLWLDEMLTMVDFLVLPLREIVAVFPSQNQHMLYSVLARGCVVLFGETAAAARLPAVFFGVASIWALFVLGRRTNGTREALLACVIMTVSYHHIWFSQNARGYSGLLFFTITATWCWQVALDRGTARWWVGYAASVCLGLWVHMTMFFVVGAHGLVYLMMVFASRRGVHGAPRAHSGFRWRAPIAWFFTATATLQLHALSLPEFLRSALHEESRDSEWTNPLWVIRETLHRLADGGFVGVAALAALAVLAVGLASVARRDRGAAAVMVLPALLGGGTMLALGHNLWPRFFFFCMGFFLLMAVRGATVIWRIGLTPLVPRASLERHTYRMSTVACLAVAAVSAWTVPRVYALPKQDFSGARDFVESSRTPDDAVVGVGLAGVAFRRYFAPQWHYIESAAELEELERRHETVWLVYTLAPQLRGWHPDIWEVVERDFSPVRVFYGTLGGGEIYVCRRSPQGALPEEPPALDARKEP